MKSGQVTIKDLARELGISPSTVSRALSGHSDISDLTIKRVTELAKKYNYQPNAIALSLRSSKTRTIGVIIPEIANFFFATVISGIEDVAAKNGYNVILCHSSERYEKEVKDARALLTQRVDGLLVSISKSSSNFDHFDPFFDQKRPVIFFDRVPPKIKTSSIVVEDEQGAFEAVEHLIEQGCRRIVHLVGPTMLSISIRRLKGYKRALENHGIQIDPKLMVDCGHSANWKEADDIVTGLLDMGLKFDGIFAYSDITAAGAIKAIRRKGIKIPEEIAVIGYANWHLSALVEPALSSVHQPAYEMGQKAAQMLFDQLNHPNKPIRNERLKTYVVKRESSVRS